jgi:hypothetical protein
MNAWPIRRSLIRNFVLNTLCPLDIAVDGKGFSPTSETMIPVMCTVGPNSYSIFPDHRRQLLALVCVWR